MNSDFGSGICCLASLSSRGRATNKKLKAGKARGGLTEGVIPSRAEITPRDSG